MGSKTAQHDLSIPEIPRKIIVDGSDLISLAEKHYQKNNATYQIINDFKKRGLFFQFLRSLSIQDIDLSGLDKSFADIIRLIVDGAATLEIKNHRDLVSKESVKICLQVLESKKQDILGLPDQFFSSFSEIMSDQNFDITQIKTYLYSAMHGLLNLMYLYLSEIEEEDSDSLDADVVKTSESVWAQLKGIFSR